MLTRGMPCRTAVLISCEVYRNPPSPCMLTAGRPDRPAVSIQGDGGFLYTSQEINTAVRQGIPLVSIVLNNRCHGAEKYQQQRFFDKRYIGVDLVNPRFDRLA